MVKEKDSDNKYRVDLMEMFRRTREEIDKNTIRFSWHVVEYTPGYNTGGYYDTDVPAKHTKVSPDFDKEEDAHAWMERHEPDEGKSLYVKRIRLFRRVYTEWVDY